MSALKPDRSKMMASQLASKAYFAGEALGFRLGRLDGITVRTYHGFRTYHFRSITWLRRSFTLATFSRSGDVQGEGC